MKRGLAAAGLVLGLPINLDGTEGPRAQSTRAFARNLDRLADMPIVFWDERLSTVAAERALLEADMSRAKRREIRKARFVESAEAIAGLADAPFRAARRSGNDPVSLSVLATTVGGFRPPWCA